MKNTTLVVLMLGMSLAVSGCGRSSKAVTTTNVSTVSAGQELTDLKAAYDSGAITEKEYNKKRDQILKSKN
ncbi:MAG: SHOCT domain-containing protein [Marinosulfonomonas sp.]